MNKVAKKQSAGVPKAVLAQRKKVATLEVQLKEAIQKLESIDPVIIEAKEAGLGKCIDGLESVKTYVVAACLKDSPDVRLAVRCVNDTYRLHFFPNSESMRMDFDDYKTTQREEEGYETVWVDKAKCNEVLTKLAKRATVVTMQKDKVLAGNCCA